MLRIQEGGLYVTIFGRTRFEFCDLRDVGSGTFLSACFPHTHAKNNIAFIIKNLEALKDVCKMISSGSVNRKRPTSCRVISVSCIQVILKFNQERT